jgi:NADPH:quinone reductase-like Zn-dependent oxidoreductase
MTRSAPAGGTRRVVAIERTTRYRGASMRAWLLRDTSGPDAYELGEVPTPEPGAGEVRVSLRASALNHLDLWVARGMPAPPSFPHVGGADGAGVIDAVGADVTDAGVGDEVVIDPSTSCARCPACMVGDVPFCPNLAIVGEHRWGTHADAIVLPEVNVARKPSALSWTEAAAVGLVTSSALRMLRRGRVDERTTVLATGIGGGTSTAGFLLAQAMGATMFATSRDAAKRAWATDHGARAAFDSDGAFDEQVRAATDGRGVDVVLDNIGAAVFGRALRALARGGRYVTNGSTTGRTAELHLPTLFWRQLEVIGSTMNDHREFADAMAFVAGGVAHVPVDRVFAFEELPQALARLDAGEQLGKIVLDR